MQTYDIKLIDFLSNSNTLLIENEEQYKQFQQIVEKINLSTIRLDETAKRKNYILLIEYRNDAGFTFWNDKDSIEEAVKKSTEWYYQKPFKIKDIL